MSSPASASFPFMLLPKELRLVVYEFLAEEIDHAVFYTGDSLYHPCCEPLVASIPYGSAFEIEICKLGARRNLSSSVERFSY
jgi:hypothetical protein